VGGVGGGGGVNTWPPPRVPVEVKMPNGLPASFPTFEAELDDLVSQEYNHKRK
jgi:hypothetical protein